MPSPTDIIVAAGEDLQKRMDSAPSSKKHKEVEFLDALVQESSNARSEKGKAGNGLSFEDMAARNQARFLGDHTSSFTGASIQSRLQEEGHRFPVDNPSTAGGVVKATLNRTQTAILATHAAMTERPVQVSFTPVESDDLWLFALKPAAVRQLAMFMQDPSFVAQINPRMPLGQPQLRGFSASELAGEEFIDAARAQFLMDALKNPLTGAPLLKDSDFYIVNDVTTARAGKRLFDNRWSESNADEAVAEHALYCRIFGFQPMFFQWDTHNERFWLENPHGLSVYPDPVHTRIDQFDYLVWDYYLDLAKAESMYPKLKKKLRDAASKGKLEGKDTKQPAIYSDHSYERKMVQIRTGWIKNAKVAMTEQEALLKGAVFSREGRRGPPQLIRTDTNEVVTPPSAEDYAGSANWPKTYGILQVQVLPQIDVTVDKRRCPYMVEPFAWTVNIQCPHRAWGLGDPFRLEDCQKAINRELTTLTTHSRFHAFPTEFWPADLLDDLQRRGFDASIRPGRRIPIEPRLYERMLGRGGISITQMPPPLPRDRMELLRDLLAEHDRISGHVEALQGRTPGAQTSGRTIQQLRQEARGPLGIQARALESTVTRIAKLGMDAITKWMSPERSYEILNGYPSFVVDAFLERLKEGKYNVDVKATMGRGILEQVDKQESQALFGMGALDLSTLLEDHNRNPEPIKRRRKQDIDDQAEAAAAQQPQQASPAGSGQSPLGGTPAGGAMPAQPAQPFAPGEEIGTLA